MAHNGEPHELPDPESFWRWFRDRMTTNPPNDDTEIDDLSNLSIEEARARTAAILAKFPDPFLVADEGVSMLNVIGTFISPEAEAGEGEPTYLLGFEQDGRTAAFRGSICDLGRAFRAIMGTLLASHAEMHENRAAADPKGHDAQMKRMADFLTGRNAPKENLN